MARRGHRVLRGTVRRMSQWLASADVVADQALAAGSILFDQSLNATALALRPFTVVRTRGELWVRSDQIAANELPFGALGFCIVSDTATALGVTAIPAPIISEDSDLWFVYQHWLASVRVATAVGFDDQAFTRYSFDSKAQRKVNNDQDIAVMLENASAANGVSLVLKFRILIKLH